MTSVGIIISEPILDRYYNDLGIDILTDQYSGTAVQLSLMNLGPILSLRIMFRSFYLSKLDAAVEFSEK